MKILVVDDEAEMLKIMERYLKRVGYQVLDALSAEEALKHLNDSTNKIDLVLTDYAMPGMDGIALLKNIRKTHDSLPVIMMTGYGNKDLVIEALRYGCDSFIEKPFTFEQLLVEIKRIKLRRAEKLFSGKSSRKNIFTELDEISFHSHAIYVAGKLLSTGLDLNKMTDMVTDMFVELMRVDLGYLMLFYENSRELRVKAVKGLKQKQIKNEISIKIDKDVVKRIIDWKKPILLSELDDLKTLEFFRNISKEARHEIALSVPLLGKDNLVGLINLGAKERKKQFSQEDLRLLSTISGHIAIAIENAKLYENLLKSYLSTVSSLAEAIETKDPYTRGHSERVSEYATIIAKALNLPGSEIEGVRVAGILHDIGKIGLPEGILLKFAPLTNAEFGIIKEHSMVSAKIIGKADFPWEIKLLALHHHERYDGTGYPDGLKGEDIPFGARILAVADTYEALLADRPYRRGLPKEKALEIIKKAAGPQLDPNIVPVFLDLVEKGEIE